MAQWRTGRHPANESPYVPFRELHDELMDYEGEAAFDDVLRPWLENNFPAIEQLRSLGASAGGAIPPMSGEELWFLYSVHRVLELLVLRFQTPSPGGSDEPGPAISLGEFFRFARGIGADIVNPRPWSPFHHEVVGLAPTSPAIRPGERRSGATTS